MRHYYNNLVKIGVNKSLLKEFFKNSQRVVYMDDYTEFQIQIFNPYTFVIGVSISINGTEMPNKLVIKPGQRIWLERYLNEARKFLFETYEVNNSESTKNAIKKNGEIYVRFYKEQDSLNEYSIDYINDHYISYTDINEWKSFPSQYVGQYSGQCSDGGYQLTASQNGINGFLHGSNISSVTTANYGCKDMTTMNNCLNATVNYACSDNRNCIETGRIEKGSHSNQYFTNTYYNFNYIPFNTETIHILPKSQKPVYTNELKKIYCTNCGRKIKTNFKYCPHCGSKI